MRSFLFFMTVIPLLLGNICHETLGAEKAEDFTGLPALIIPEVPLDNNPFRRDVFSLKEVRDGDPELLQRIITTRMDFPLMFEPHSAFSAKLFSNPDRARFGKNFAIVMWIDSIVWPEESTLVLRALKRELAAQGLDQGRSERELRIEQMLFLENYGALCEYADCFPDVSESARREIIETFREVRDVCRQVLEFKALTLNGIRTLDQIDARPGEGPEEEGLLKLERFVMESKDMKPEDHSSILEVRNPAQFRELCLERTSEMLADEDGKGVEELLADLEPSDAIVLASYFARNRIHAYRKPDEQMYRLHEATEQETDEQLTVGDCKYFAGLTVHYLNLLVKPRNSKLAHWYFGIERENVADYHHVYVKAVHVYKEGGEEKIELFFFDPVALSSESLGKLRSKDIRRLIDAASNDNHFFSIKRYGEDFVARKYVPENSQKDTQRKELEGRKISFEAPLADQ